MKIKKLLSSSFLALALPHLAAVQGATHVVTTANNVNPPGGSLSLVQAMGMLQKGDTITFNIPGNGPHILVTPPGGYPLITADNVTINGYSQPGSAPNTNTILAANSAKIGIVLDSRNGNSRLLDFAGDSPNDQTGYGDTESAVIGILAATNVTIRGLSIISVPLTGPGGDVALYGISFAKGAQGHINGCWIGIAPDGTVAGPADGITGFRYRVRNENNTVLRDILVNDVVIGVGKSSSNPRSEFNVIMGIPAIPIIIEGGGTRISGNFINVFPNGVQDWNPPLVDPNLFSSTWEGNIEIGRSGNNTVIGVDGDGVNDAEERNVLSGGVPPSLGGYAHNIEFYGQTPGTNIVIAGNYIGLGVDGSTRFTNGIPALNAGGGSAQFRFGSDFNGVSDALEGNVVYNNWPGDLFQTTGTEGFFDQLSTGAILGARGNSMVNNFPFPVSPARDGGGFWTTYYSKALADSAAGVVPTLGAGTSLTRLVGRAPVPNTEYTNVVIDLYAADPEGIEFGMSAGAPESPNGYIQGKSYIGSFVDNSAADANKAVGEFDFNISNLELRGSLLTVTASYSKTAAGTTNGIYITSPFSDVVEVTFLPGSIESVGLSRVVSDTLVIPVESDALGNWEPYASVLGNSHFLIEGNTFAEGTADQQRYVVRVQPVEGGAGKTLEAFYGDNGAPFNGPINLSRQNGNPGRVAGDKRPGATNFITGGEVSLHGYQAFQSDNRWARNEISTGENRYAAVQTFGLNHATLDAVPLSKAMDPVHAANTGAVTGNVPEVSRFGGELAALDNGNFVVVIDDRSFFMAPRRTATAAIITPAGQIVKEGFAIDGAVDNQIWSNVAAYRGGFCVRFNGSLYFFDNAGNLQGSVDQNTSGETFDRGRGDGVRIAAHINSPYVFLAGKVTTANEVKLVAWDSRDRTFVAKGVVSEGAFTGGFDRANLAVDALNRVVVGWVSQPAGYEMQQVAARVMALDPATKTISALTKSFLPFANNAQSGGIRTIQMSLAMTTKQILVAAKGEINLQNQPSAGANSPREVNFYTVITHPAPAEDPTTPAGGGAGAQLSIAVAGPNSLRLNWTGGTGPFLVQRKSSFSDANWMNVLTTTENTALVPNDGTTGFFRVMNSATTTVMPMSIVLGGAFEKPNAVNTPATGRGTISLEGNTLAFDIKYSGLTANANNMHIHGFATTADSVGVIHDLKSFNTPATLGTQGRIAGSVTLTEEQKTRLLAGDTYVNIHSTANNPGEIRGQITPSILRATLNGANERPAIDSPATGTGTFTLVGDELFMDVSYTGLRGAISNAHIHGPADSNTSAGVLVGGVYPDLHVGPVAGSTAGRFVGRLTLTPAQINAVIDGLSYFNIHSAFAGGGEIRGQIVP